MSEAHLGPIKELTITWRVKNYIYSWLHLLSPPFVSHCFSDTIFFLKVKKETSPTNKQIKICILSNNRNLSSLDYEVALVTSDGSPEESVKEDAFVFEANCNRIGAYDEWVKETLVVSTKTITEERRDAFLPRDTLTIRCRLLQREVDCFTSEEGFADSSIGVRRKLFIWKLNEINDEGTYVYPYLFSFEGTYGHLRLKASIKGEHEEKVFVEVHRDKGEKIFATLKISLLDAHGTSKQITSDTFFFEKSNEEQVWKLPPLISRRELLASKNQLMPNDTLTLKCEFAASLGLVGESETITCPRELISTLNYYDISRFSKYPANDKLSSGSLQRDLKCILDTGSLSDFKLRVNSDVFPVHRALLGARSPTFNAMFTNDYQETSSGYALISDINADSVRRFLVYLYTDKTENLTIESATELYFVADKYGVISLKEICASFLKANLSSSCACEVLILADRHQDEELKSAVLDFLSKHKSEILCSEDWRDLEKSNHLLALDTLREICLQKSTK